MSDAYLSSMYSKKALEELENTLQLHRGMVWIDPTTNTFAVKRITNQIEEEDPQDLFPSVNA